MKLSCDSLWELEKVWAMHFAPKAHERSNGSIERKIAGFV